MLGNVCKIEARDEPKFSSVLNNCRYITTVYGSFISVSALYIPLSNSELSTVSHTTTSDVSSVSHLFLLLY